MGIFLLFAGIALAFTGLAKLIKIAIKKDGNRKIPMLLMAVGVLLMIFAPVNPPKNEAPKPPPVTYEEVNTIEVALANVKKLDNVYRYFFTVKNVGNKPFNGRVEIKLKNGLGKIVDSGVFTPEPAIEPKLAKIAYIDSETGPKGIYGDHGVVDFTFAATQRIEETK